MNSELTPDKMSILYYEAKALQTFERCFQVDVLYLYWILAHF